MGKNDALREKAKSSAKLAYSPYSKLLIGCAILTAQGNIYTGCNVENASYGCTICAERVAVYKAISEGDREFSKVYLYSKQGFTPCGYCRQVLNEFANGDLEIIIGNEVGNEVSYKLKDLLPQSFNM